MSWKCKLGFHKWKYVYEPKTKAKTKAKTKTVKFLCQEVESFKERIPEFAICKRCGIAVFWYPSGYYIEMSNDFRKILLKCIIDKGDCYLLKEECIDCNEDYNRPTITEVKNS